jgi:hypothetical protein
MSLTPQQVGKVTDKGPIEKPDDSISGTLRENPKGKTDNTEVQVKPKDHSQEIHETVKDTKETLSGLTPEDHESVQGLVGGPTSTIAMNSLSSLDETPKTITQAPVQPTVKPTPVILKEIDIKPETFPKTTAKDQGISTDLTISRDNLKGFMSDPAKFTQLQAFNDAAFTGENVKFLGALQSIFSDPSKITLESLKTQIFDKFISSNAPDMINIPNQSAITTAFASNNLPDVISELQKAFKEIGDNVSTGSGPLDRFEKLEIAMTEKMSKMKPDEKTAFLKEAAKGGMDMSDFGLQGKGHKNTIPVIANKLLEEQSTTKEDIGKTLGSIFKKGSEVDKMILDPKVGPRFEAFCKANYSFEPEFYKTLQSTLGELQNSGKSEREIVGVLKEKIFDQYIKGDSAKSLNIEFGKDEITEAFNKQPPDLKAVLKALDTGIAQDITVNFSDYNRRFGPEQASLTEKIKDVPSIKDKVAILQNVVDSGVSRSEQALAQAMIDELKPALKAETGLKTALGNKTGKELINELNKYSSGEKTLPGVDKDALKEVAAGKKSEALSKMVPDIPIDDPVKLSTYITELDKSTSKWFGLKSSGNEDMKAILSGLKELQDIAKNDPGNVVAKFDILMKVQESAKHYIDNHPKGSKVEIVKGLLPKTQIEPPAVYKEITASRESLKTLDNPTHITTGANIDSIETILNDKPHFEAFKAFCNEKVPIDKDGEVLKTRDEAKFTDFISDFRGVMGKEPPDKDDVMELINTLLNPKNGFKLSPEVGASLSLAQSGLDHSFEDTLKNLGLAAKEIKDTIVKDVLPQFLVDGRAQTIRQDNVVRDHLGKTGLI